MYVLSDLASQFLQNTQSAKTHIRISDLQAVDANVVDDRYVLVVLPEGIHMFDTAKQSEDEDGLNGTAKEELLRARWEKSTVKATTSRLPTSDWQLPEHSPSFSDIRIPA
jgi:hypothetical protein